MGRQCCSRFDEILLTDGNTGQILELTRSGWQCGRGFAIQNFRDLYLFEFPLYHTRPLSYHHQPRDRRTWAFSVLYLRLSVVKTTSTNYLRPFVSFFLLNGLIMGDRAIIIILTDVDLPDGSALAGSGIPTFEVMLFQPTT